VQGSPSSQSSGAPATQVPPRQVSSVVQASWSVQAVPSARATNWQPLVRSHESTVQALPSLQSSIRPNPQAPDRHDSPLVQALPSSQAAPSATAACWQPAAGSHVSTVQTSPSSQAVPSAGTWTHAPYAGSGLSVVQTLPSSHAWELPIHTPFTHASPIVSE